MAERVRKYRKGDFVVPYPWCESDKLTRRYRDGWFDARDHGVHTERMGLYASEGRRAYLAGFEHYLAEHGASLPAPPPGTAVPFPPPDPLEHVEQGPGAGAWD